MIFRSALTLLAFLLSVFFTSLSLAAPVRVATLIPNVNSGLEADPAGYELVATVRTSMHAPNAAAPFDLGNPHSPSIEQLVASKPDLVIGDANMHARLATQLEPLGLNLLLMDTATSDSLLEGLQAVAERPPRSEVLADRAQQAAQDLAGLRLPEPVEVVALFGVPGSFYLVSERWWLGDMMKNLGFENLVPDVPNERYPGLVPVNDERVAILKPQIVFLISHGEPEKIVSEFKRMAMEGGVWASIGNAPLGVHVLNPELFMATPGLTAPDAARELIRLTSTENP